MRIFVLTEIDSTDYKWCYNETFYEKEKAVARMKEMYHDDVVEREDLVIKSELKSDSAYAEMVDGVELSWNIKETEIQ